MTQEVRAPFASGRIRDQFVKLRQVANEPSAQPAGRAPATVTGGYGTVPAAQVDIPAPAPAPKLLSPKEADRLAQAEIIHAMQSAAGALTEITARLGGRQGAVNGVLLSRYLVLDADGQASVSTPVTIGSAVVEHVDEAAAQPIYAVAGGMMSAPGPGATGVQRIQPGREKRLPVGSHILQVWGQPGAVVNVQLFTGLQPYGVAL